MPGQLPFHTFACVLRLDELRAHFLLVFGLLLLVDGLTSRRLSRLCVSHLFIFRIHLPKYHVCRFNSLNRSRKAIIAQLDRTVLVNQNIRWLQIPMNDLALMQVLDGAQQVVDDGLDVQDL